MFRITTLPVGHLSLRGDGQSAGPDSAVGDAVQRPDCRTVVPDPDADLFNKIFCSLPGESLTATGLCAPEDGGCVVIVAARIKSESDRGSLMPDNHQPGVVVK